MINFAPPSYRPMPTFGQKVNKGDITAAVLMIMAGKTDPDKTKVSPAKVRDDLNSRGAAIEKSSEISARVTEVVAEIHGNIGGARAKRGLKT